MPAPIIDDLPPAPQRSDQPAVFVTKADAFVGALGAMVSQINTALTWIHDQIVIIIALVANGGFVGSSTTSLTLGTGTKTLTVDTGLNLAPGMFMVIASTANPATAYMLVQVVSYNSVSGALVANSYAGQGSGTVASWSIAPSGPGREVMAPVTASVSGSYTPDFGPATGFSTAINFQWTLTGNLTLNTPTNMTSGQSGVIYFVQDGTGSRTLSLHSSIKRPGGVAPTLSTTPGAVDRCGYFVRGSVLELTILERNIS
jgi:hypothetical protein